MIKINAQFVIEILGRPAEHVKTSLSQLVDRLGSEKGVKIVSKIIHEPNPVEKSDLFTTFAEIMAEFDSLADYLKIVFTYMPSHIEIISPESLIMKNTEITDIGNTILSKLHQYDSVTKTVLVDRDNLIKQLNEVVSELRNLKKKYSEKEKTEEKIKEKKEN